MYSETANNVSTQSLTPATDGGSAWEKLGGFVEKIGSQAISIFNADRAAKLSEKQLDIEGSILRNQIASNSLAASTAANQGYGSAMSDKTKKILIAGGITVGVVILAAVLIRMARK